MLHDLMLALQSWWLDEAAGPQLLFGFRMVSGALALFAFGTALWNALSPNELEKTWDESDAKRFKFIAWFKAFGVFLGLLYFLMAAVFESERTSSPHRLLWNSIWASCTFLGMFVDVLAWRFHYYRKRMDLSEKGENVAVKL